MTDLDDLLIEAMNSELEAKNFYNNAGASWCNLYNPKEILRCLLILMQ